VVSSHIRVAALLGLLQGIAAGSQVPAQGAQDQDVVIRRASPQAQDRGVVTRQASPEEPDVVIRRAPPQKQNNNNKEVVARPAQKVLSRVVSREEGTAIAQLTLQHWPQVRDKPDCSHLVHDVYAEAGLDYDYASSNEIFEGIDSFQRVEQPQAGDLVAWRGHVGIVIDPEDHSFYSSVNAGFSVSQFDSSYWLSRGPRRFYRYMINDLQSARLLERAARGKPYLASYRAKLAGNPVDHADNRLAVSTPDRGAGAPFADRIRSVDPVMQSPAKPTMDQILAAFMKLSDSNAQALLQTGFLNGPIEILDSFQLSKTETRNSSIWVEFKVKKIAFFADGKMRAAHATEKVRLSLLRQSGRWTLVDPANRVFLLRHDAVAMITGRLARLSRASDTAELKPLSKALETLLGEDAPLEPRPGVDLGFQESRAR